MPEPIFTTQRWRLYVFGLFYVFTRILKRRNWKKLDSFIATHVVSDYHYFQAKYALNSRIWICPRHTVGRHVLRYGIYEPVTSFLIERFVRNGFSFIDIGANVGTHTILAAKSRSGSNPQRIVAFEPLPSTYQVLLENCRLNDLDNVESIMAAVSDHAGVGVIVQLASDPALVMTVENTSSSNSPVDDQCVYVNLDDFCADTGWVEPTVVKIDVQGFEPRVFRGAHRAFGQMSELMVVFEIDVPWLKRAGFTLNDLQASVNELKFDRMFVLDEKEGGVQKLNPEQIVTIFADQRRYSNVLAVKGRMAQTLLDEYIQQLPNLPANLQPRAQPS
ncbi:MAG: FkbM family methyltransferase [Anaerolineae bacterium]